MALYAQGVMLEAGGDGSDTNASKKAAFDAFSHAARLDPDNPKIAAVIANNLFERELLGEALESLEQFLRRNQGEQELRLVAARVADAADRPADAARHCRHLLDAQPENREIAQVLIRLYFLSGQTDKALELMREQHVRFNDDDSATLPVHWAVHFSRDAEHQDTAIACIQTAIDLREDPKMRAALNNLAAECWLNLGHTNKAVSCLLEAYRENEAEHAPLIRLGTIWSGMPDAVEALAKKASQPSATCVDRMILAAAHQALGDKEAAIRILEDVYAMRMREGYFPEAGFYLWLASLLESQKALPATEAWLKRALASHPHSHELQNFMAYMWAEQGVNLVEATELINAALADQPQNAAYLDTKGWVLYKEGRFYEALQYLLKAAENDNEEPVILDHVGDALLSVGRDGEAVDFWTQSYKFDPQPSVAEKLRRHGAQVPEPTP
ncbi:MAG: tetratricopeptide repeat protein [Kiritimatiellae bacterium]|nr:tetratricopeptide repeat protein [Kiritimatiellia bacterium]